MLLFAVILCSAAAHTSSPAQKMNPLTSTKLMRQRGATFTAMMLFSPEAQADAVIHALADAKNLPEIERIAKACADGVMDAMPTERIISGITVTMFCAGCYYYASEGMAGALKRQDLLKALGLSGANDPTDTGMCSEDDKPPEDPEHNKGALATDVTAKPEDEKPKIDSPAENNKLMIENSKLLTENNKLLTENNKLVIENNKLKSLKIENHEALLQRVAALEQENKMLKVSVQAAQYPLLKSEQPNEVLSAQKGNELPDYEI